MGHPRFFCALLALVACRSEDHADAQRYAAAGDIARARTIVHRLLEENPDSAESLFLLGKIELTARDLDAAAEAFSHAADLSDEIQPRIANAYWMAARRVYSARPATIDSLFADAVAEAIDHDEAVVDEFSDWTLRTARIEAANENVEKAIKLLELSAAIQPNDKEKFAAVSEELAHAAFARRDWTAAESLIERTLAIDASNAPHAAVLYRDLALEYAAAEDLDLAREKLSKALELSPFLEETDDDCVWLMRVRLESNTSSGARVYLEAFPFGKHRAEAEAFIAAETTFSDERDPTISNPSDDEPSEGPPAAP